MSSQPACLDGRISRCRERHSLPVTPATGSSCRSPNLESSLVAQKSFPTGLLTDDFIPGSPQPGKAMLCMIHVVHNTICTKLCGAVVAPGGQDAIQRDETGSSSNPRRNSYDPTNTSAKCCAEVVATPTSNTNWGIAVCCQQPPSAWGCWSPGLPAGSVLGTAPLLWVLQLTHSPQF